MDLKNWGGNLAAHSKCFPKLTDFLKIDENLTEIWQFENFCQIDDNEKPCPPFSMEGKFNKILKLSYISQIFINFKKVSEFWKAFFLNYKIPTLVFQIHSDFKELRRVLVRSFWRISRNGIFSCYFSNSHSSAKSWPFLKKSAISEILIERTTRSLYWKLNLVKVEGRYEGFYESYESAELFQPWL